MSKDMKCLGVFQYKIGETYTIDREELRLCSDKSFHFCEKLEDTIKHYNNNATYRHFLIEVLGDIVTDENNSGSNKIKVIRELSRDEIEEYIQDKDSLNAKKFLALYTTNIKLIGRLSKDEYWGIRRYIAKNLNTPVHILEYLSQDENEMIRYEVASNLNTPVYLLEKLAKDKHWIVRRAVILNLNTSVEILEQLAKDQYEYIRKIAQARLKEITQ